LVVFRWGKFYGDKPRDPGAKWIWYILDTVRFVKMWEQTIDPPPQEVITKDNIRTQVNPIIFFKVEDPISYIGGAEKTLQMIASLSETIIRDICGTKEFEEIREEREKLSLYITHILNVASGVEESTPEERASGIYIPSEKTKDPLIKGWGIRVTRVKLQGIEPPQEIVEALQKKFIAKQEADAKIEVARGDFEASKKRSDAKRYDFEQEGEGKGILIAKQVKPLNEPGGERYTAIEVAKTVKDGDKIIFTDDSVKGITGALAGMFTGRLPKPKDD
jgi:regulator of protease activity HflC (stomatin/prohibitin superfamily)